MAGLNQQARLFLFLQIKWSKQTDVGITHLRSGTSHDEDQLISSTTIVSCYYTTTKNIMKNDILFNRNIRRMAVPSIFF